MPGIKNIDVTFKGGLKTNREATISWTCWSWEEIDLLTPHFLAHGKTVLLEWGWVYDKTTLQNLQPFLIKDPKGGEGDIKIDANAFEKRSGMGAWLLLTDGLPSFVDRGPPERSHGFFSFLKFAFLNTKTR